MIFSIGAPDLLARRQLHLLAIVAGAGAVDDEEIAVGVEDEQEVVPDALSVVDALVPLRAKQADFGGVEGACGGHCDEVRPAAQRHEALAAQRVALEQDQRSAPAFAASGGARNRLITPVPPLVRDVDLGEPVVADCVALVDVELHGVVGGLDHAAEGEKASAVSGSGVSSRIDSP